MKTLHTPGPWKHHLGRGSSPRFHIQTSAGYQIVSTTELNQSKEENEMREANARLIAAAPELLEALMSVVGEANIKSLSDDDFWANVSKETIQKAIETIKKATQP